jgi:hypothetical protein
VQQANIPQATRPPALPVVLLSSCPPEYINQKTTIVIRFVSLIFQLGNQVNQSCDSAAKYETWHGTGQQFPVK